MTFDFRCFCTDSLKDIFFSFFVLQGQSIFLPFCSVCNHAKVMTEAYFSFAKEYGKRDFLFWWEEISTVFKHLVKMNCPSERCRKLLNTAKTQNKTKTIKPQDYNVMTVQIRFFERPTGRNISTVYHPLAVVPYLYILQKVALNPCITPFSPSCTVLDKLTKLQQCLHLQSM